MVLSNFCNYCSDCLPPIGRQSPITSRSHWKLKAGVQEKGNRKIEMHKGRKISRKKSEKRSE